MTRLLLKPMLSGFTADRRNFCPHDARRAADRGHGEVLQQRRGSHLQRCRDASPSRRSARTRIVPMHIGVAGPIAKNPQKVYPNMLFGALLRGPSPLRAQRRRAARAAGDASTPTCRRWSACSSPVTNAETPLTSVNLNTYVVKETQPRRAAGDQASTSCSSTTSSPWTRTAAARTSWSSAAAATT